MNIRIPDVITGEGIFSILGQVFDEEGELYSNQFTFNFESTHDIDAFTLVSMHNLMASLRMQHVEVKTRAPSLADLDPDSLIHHLELLRYNAIHVSRGVIPLVHVPAPRSSTWVLTTFNRWLAEVLGVSTLSLYTPTQFLRLLFRYAVHDGASSGVFVHAKVEKDNEELRIVLAHYGKSIAQLMRNSWAVLSNNAIDIAKSTELVEGQKGSLHFLIDDVILDNGGRLSIYSGFGRMRCLRTGFGLTQKLELNNAYFPGALFDITFHLRPTGLTSRINEPASVSEYENVQ